MKMKNKKKFNKISNKKITKITKTENFENKKKLKIKKTVNSEDLINDTYRFLEEINNKMTEIKNIKSNRIDGIINLEISSEIKNKKNKEIIIMMKFALFTKTNLI